MIKLKNVFGVDIFCEWKEGKLWFLATLNEYYDIIVQKQDRITVINWNKLGCYVNLTFIKFGCYVNLTLYVNNSIIMIVGKC